MSALKICMIFGCSFEFFWGSKSFVSSASCFGYFGYHSKGCLSETPFSTLLAPDRFLSDEQTVGILYLPWPFSLYKDQTTQIRNPYMILTYTPPGAKRFIYLRSLSASLEKGRFGT